jgi:uncharacterized protein YbjQ (UPF0145 family)
MGASSRDMIRVHLAEGAQDLGADAVVEVLVNGRRFACTVSQLLALVAPLEGREH